MNKVALVTGASRGIGKAIAQRLAREGIYVFINYKSSHKEAMEVLESIRVGGGNGQLLQGDVSNFQTCCELIERILTTCGRLDYLVNNAGVSRHGLVMDMTEETYDFLLNNNLKSAFNVTRHSLPALMKTSGAIVNVSSIWSEHGASNEVVYAMSKAGINAFTRSLAKEMAPMGVRVNGIAPGLIDTTMNDNLSQEEKTAMVCYLASQRLGTPEDVAEVVAFLLSDQAAYINGQIITIDGGLLD